jgi:hypothetical protein
MRSLDLAELPPSAAGNTGWRWTIETPELPRAWPDGERVAAYLRILIVTRSYTL